LSAGTPVESLLNLGPKSGRMLRSVGIATREELVRARPVEARAILASEGHPVSLVLAYAIEGALSGTRWDRLDPAVRGRLRGEYSAALGRGPSQ